jgi:hypothetical protein
VSAPAAEVANDEAVRVTSGAARLTERRPGWFWEIDLNRLDLKSTTDCVLGQLWDSYDEGVDALSFDWPDDDRHHGFDAYADDYTPHAFSRLRQEWIRVILELRAANP